MKKYTIKYQDGMNILLENVEANSSVEARYKFYMDHPTVDILSIEEVK